MGLKGDLGTMGLEDIFQWLAVGKKTGVLEMKGILHTKRVSFQQGRITGIWSTNPREYIGQYLLSHNCITETQLKEALVAQEDENQLLGRILVERQLITPDQVSRIVQVKVEEGVYDLFLWDVGTFEFQDCEIIAAKPPVITLDVTGLVLEGARRMDEWKRIRQVLKGGDAVVDAISEAIAEKLPLAPEDADILGRIDGVKSLDDLVIEMRTPDFKVAKHVFDLFEKGMVRVVNPGGKLNDVSSIQLQRAKQMLEKQQLEEAQVVLKKLAQEQPKLQEASRLLGVVENLLDENRLDGTLVPELAISLEDLMQAQLGPNEAFLATRVNGVWSIKDIISISPLPAEECLSIFAGLLKRGILKTIPSGGAAKGLEPRRL